MKTSDLIELLVANVASVKRLRPPLVRAILWLLFAAFVLFLIGISHGVRLDFAERIQQPMFVIGIIASLSTGILAAIASFMISLPDRSRLWLLLPIPTFVVWMTTIGYGCLAAWVSVGPMGIRLGDAVECLVTLILTSVPTSAAMLIMLRYAALYRAVPVATMGSLAVAAITASGLLIFHPLDATAMILMWNLGTAVIIVGLGSLFGRGLFTWAAMRLLPQRR
ncbi:MAG: NrsF family protein [Alphaproteobacteria bacterium]